MRIASNQYHATMNSALQAANAGLSQVMQQMASGQRIMKPSDDTIATVRMARLSREEAALKQYADNAGALKTRLQTSEVTLDSIKQDLMAARDLLVWAGDGGNTGADLGAMAGSLEALRESLFYTSNTKNAEGKFLFSGTASDQPTVDAAYAFQGNTGTQDVAVADSVSLAANVSLQDMGAFLSQLNDLIVLLKDPLVTAAGVRPDVEQTLNDLDSTLNDVSAKISVLGGRQNVLQTMADNQAAISLANKQAYIDLAQLDYGEASVRLNSHTLAVQATQKAYAKVSQLSLFNAF